MSNNDPKNKRFGTVSEMVFETLEAKKAANIVITMFVQEVERRAEDKMLLTGKLEGAHYAAMKQVAEEWSKL